MPHQHPRWPTAAAAPGAVALRAGRAHRSRAIRHLLPLTAALLASQAPSQAGPLRPGGAPTALAQPVAVFGSDERIAIPARYKDLASKIGLLVNRRSRLVCTAFCVAPDVIATAGHCLHRTHGERPPQLADVVFARNYDKERHFTRIAGSDHGAAGQHVMSGSMDLSVRPPIDASKDWALLRLSQPACQGGVLAVAALPTEAIIAAAAAKQVFQISYHRDFTPFRPAYSRPCEVARSFGTADWATIARDFADPEQLVLHTCDTGGASSGSPLILETAAGLAVVAINIGTYVQSKVLLEDGQVTKRLKAETVANTAINSRVFASKLLAFRQAAILASPAQIRELQTILKQRQLYAGSIDGSYGAALHAAIEAYERARQLPVTGLATEALMQRLEADLRPAAKGS
jgi:Putative peptidoglycan binding domain/Trypsin-like peptidase domain